MSYPSIVRRVQALFVDTLIMLIAFVITSQIVGATEDVPNWLRASIFLFIVLLYDPLLIAFNGATIGHSMLKLRVKKAEDTSSNIHIGNAIIRFVIKAFLGWLSFLTVTRNERRRAIHDMFSGSVVIDIRK